MTRDRFIQLSAIGLMVISLIVGGLLLPGILKQSEDRSLRYTDVSVEGAPPIVALGTAIGAMRGLIVDLLWVRVHLMKQAGQFYEVMTLSDLITKLQPRFAKVWAFHAHNMAYNISVATHTLEERWEWVNAGIDLLRNKGIRANPDNLNLYRELAWFFAHKVDGITDDAHNYYKEQFAREWYDVLGEPPREQQDRAEWLQQIADAPSYYSELIAQTPEAGEIVERLRTQLEVPNAPEFDLYVNLSTLTNQWEATVGGSFLARQAGLSERFDTAPLPLRVYNDLRNDPELEAGWDPLVRHVRKRRLIDRYNMKPDKMAMITRDVGPFDWRHPQSHAYYWSFLGAGERTETTDENGHTRFEYQNEKRLIDDDVYKILNNDRIRAQAMQGLARTGLITFDPYSLEVATRAPDPRWVDGIDKIFEEFYIKHFDARGAGGETFIEFIKNFMDDAVRMWYRSGEQERAQRCLDRLDDLFGSGAMNPNNYYSVPLDVYVMRETKEQYESQPHIAPAEVIQSMRYGIRVGIGRDRPEVYQDSLEFANQVREFFKTNEWFDYDTKFGGRITDLLGTLEDSLLIAFIQLMTDPSVSMEERMSIWSLVDKHQPQLRARTFDQIMPALYQQWEGHQLSTLVNSDGSLMYPFKKAFPPPPNLEVVRAQMAAEAAREANQEDITNIKRK